ncbi:MAG: PBSX family phage terminase large subunit [Oscillospiraceae bacterium]|jgi:PBSX family phage terminase large subunit|nr:PBSX family phage terminase large subunit [Oscillospiraceae bacterium]
MKFSKKQRVVLNWWRKKSPHHSCEAIICDGAVRSGKTLCMGLSFFLWAMSDFRGARFGICGKTISSLRRNVLTELLPKLSAIGFSVKEKRSENLVRVTYRGRSNDFYIFGGRDESSSSLIQGITFAGVLLDEVALMPRSFVEQACARCSVSGSRLWFNCNPEGPRHWFYTEWVCNAQARNCLYLHFTMQDNPALSPAIRQRYSRLYSGVFFRRFVLGQWVAAEGRVYDFFDAADAPSVPTGTFSKWYISCDYGTVNPASFGLWGQLGGVWYRVKEFYFDSRQQMRQMTDAEYADALEQLAGSRKIEAIIVDPSAASFIETLRRRGLHVKRADNDVISGIRRTSDLLKSGKLVICDTCGDCLREMEQYVWDTRAGTDTVKKEHDHAMDDMRYFAATVLSHQEAPIAARAIVRRG